MSRKELSRMTWDPSGWMIISEVEFKTPSDLTSLASRLSSMGLDEETVLRIVVAYETDDHGLVDFGRIITPSLAISLPLILWTPEGKSWAHPSISSCGVDFRRGTSLKAILAMAEVKHVVCLSRSTIGRYINHGFAYLVHPIFTADVTSALEMMMTKMMKSFSEWSRLTPCPTLADFDLRISGRRILSLSDDESERALDESTLLVPSVCSRVNRRRRRRHMEPVVPPVVDSECTKLDSDLVIVHLNCGGCNPTKLTLLLEMMISKKADLMCLSDTGETPGPRNALESHARHILNRHASAWGIHTIKAIPSPGGAHSHPPGGALVLFNLSRLSRVKINSILDFGLLFEVEFFFGTTPVIVTSTYFPPKRWGTALGPASVEAQILGLMEGPGEAVEHMKTILRNRLVLSSGRNVISFVGGDFNSNFHSDDGYKISSFFSELDFVNASNQEEKLLPSFCRRALDQIRTSRIDNVFTKRDARVRVLSCYPHLTDVDLYDHYPMFTHMRMRDDVRPLFGTRTKRNLPRDIHSTDSTAFALFTKQLEEMDIPEEVLLCPEKLVEWISVTSGALACSISKCRHSRSCPNHWSIVAMVILVHLRASVLLRRHVATKLKSSTVTKTDTNPRV